MGREITFKEIKVGMKMLNAHVKRVHYEDSTLVVSVDCRALITLGSANLGIRQIEKDMTVEDVSEDELAMTLYEVIDDVQSIGR